MSSRPLEIPGKGRLYAPAWNLWVWSQARWQYVRRYDARIQVGKRTVDAQNRSVGSQMVFIGAAAAFGHRQVAELEADPARRMSPSQILAKHREAQERNLEKKEGARAERRSDTLKANSKRAMDLLSGKSGRRQARVASFKGQTNRGTPGEILSDAREDGWELPSKPRENRCADVG